MKFHFYILLIFFPVLLSASSDSDKVKAESIQKINEEFYHIKLIGTDIINWSVNNNPINNSIQIEKWEGFDKNDSELLHISNSNLIHSEIVKDKLHLLYVQNDELFIDIPFNPFKRKIMNIDLYDSFRKSQIVENNNTYYILFDKRMIVLDSNYRVKEQIRNVIDLKLANSSILTYLIENQNDYLLRISYGFIDSEIRLEGSKNAYLRTIGDSLVVINEFNSNSLVNIIDPSSGIIFKEWINSSADLIDVYKSKNSINLSYVISSNYYKKDLESKEERSITVDMLPIAIRHFDNWLFLISSGEIKIIDPELNELTEIQLHNSGEIRSIKKVFEDHFVIKNEFGYQLFKIKDNPQWWINYIIGNYLLFALITILLVTLFYLIRQLRIKNSLLRTLIDLPSSGIVIRFGKSGELITINSLGRKFLKMSNKVPLGSYFEAYMRGGEYAELHGLMTKAIRIKEDFSQKISILYDRNIYDLFCTITCVRNPAGFFEGIILSAVDITEELERKRMANWAQLAHDMQTNLATIKLNAEQLELDDESINSGRRKKIVHQVNLLINKVRDIVTVGRSDKINRLNHMSSEIVNDIVTEFDTDLFDNVELSSDFENFTISCDKQKLIRAMRNAVENSMKAVSDAGGKVTIKAYRDNRFAYFSVMDNGRGMDQTTQRNMLNPFFTTDKNKGGSGIGSMIMQNVAEQHGGELIIRSTINEGSEIIFKIPNYRN